MMITCPDCATSYRVSAATFGAQGRTVKCARCGARWVARPEEDTLSIETDLPEDGGRVREPALARAEAASDKGGPADDAFGSADEMDWSQTLPDEEDEPDAAGETGTGDGEPAARRAADDTDGADLDGLAGDLVPADDDALLFREPGGAAEAGKGPVDIETLARRPKIQVKQKEREPIIRRIAGAAVSKARQVRPRRVVGAGLFALALSLFAVAFSFRTEIVGRLPDLASLYALAGLDVNLRGLEFRDLRTFRELEDGAIVLVIEGTVENVTAQSAYVPAIRFALRSEDAQEIYAWVVEPRIRHLDRGETTRIRTRLASPPDLAADIHVRFIDRTNAQQAVLR